MVAFSLSTYDKFTIWLRLEANSQAFEVLRDGRALGDATGVFILVVYPVYCSLSLVSSKSTGLNLGGVRVEDRIQSSAHFSLKGQLSTESSQ